MTIVTKTSRDIEKFEELESRLKNYDGATISYYELQRVTREYNECLRLGTRYFKSVNRLFEITKMYGGLLQRMKRQS